MYKLQTSFIFTINTSLIIWKIDFYAFFIFYFMIFSPHNLVRKFRSASFGAPFKKYLEEKIVLFLFLINYEKDANIDCILMIYI